MQDENTHKKQTDFQNDIMKVPPSNLFKDSAFILAVSSAAIFLWGYIKQEAFFRQFGMHAEAFHGNPLYLMASSWIESLVMFIFAFLLLPVILCFSLIISNKREVLYKNSSERRIIFIATYIGLGICIGGVGLYMDKRGIDDGQALIKHPRSIEATLSSNIALPFPLYYGTYADGRYLFFTTNSNSEVQGIIIPETEVRMIKLHGWKSADMNK
jgi:hypothetical protein